MAKLRSVRLLDKFVFPDVPGVWKKVSHNRAKKVFGELGTLGEEIPLEPDNDVFIIDRQERQGDREVRVIIQDSDGGLVKEVRLSIPEAILAEKADCLRTATERGVVEMDISEVGYDIERHTMCIEVSKITEVPKSEER